MSRRQPATRPPGPRGEPVFGSSRRYARDPFRFLAAVERAYGGVSRFDMGPLPVYVVADPAAIERVLVAEADGFRKPAFAGDAVGDLLGEGLLLSEGDAWRHQRQLATPAFRMDRLSSMADRITDHAEARVERWSAGDVIDVESAMTRITLDVILDLMLGVELPEERLAHLQRQLEPLGQRFEPNPLRFALPDWVPFPGDAEFDRALSALDALVDEIVATREDVGARDAPDAPTDLLAILLRARERGEQTDRQLRDEVVTTLLAGHDTTALALTYTWYLLSGHPAVEARLHDEVDSVLGGERPTMATVGDLEYTERVITEAMRLYPPVYTLFRTPTRRFSTNGYVVPPGSTVMLPQWAVHRSERRWTDPLTFDPDRFLPERSRDRHRFAYFPFGGGPRHCIGKHLALLEARLIVATVASRFRLAYEGPEPLELVPTITAHPRGEMAMRVVPRS